MHTFRRLLAVLLIAIAATLGLVTVSSGPAAACSCAIAGIESHAKWADAVFTGEVSEVANRGQSVAYTFDVDRVYGGEVPAATTVVTGNQESACGLPGLTRGRSYVVYAGLSDADVLTTGSCSGTRPIASPYVERLEQHLGEGTAPTRPVARDRTAGGTPGDGDRDGGVRTWMVVVSGAAGAMIVAGLLAGAVRLRRQAREIS